MLAPLTTPNGLRATQQGSSPFRPPNTAVATAAQGANRRLQLGILRSEGSSPLLGTKRLDEHRRGDQRPNIMTVLRKHIGN